MRIMTNDRVITYEGNLRERVSGETEVCLPTLKLSRLMCTFLTGQLLVIQNGKFPELSGCEFGIFGPYAAAETQMGVSLNVPLTDRGRGSFGRLQTELIGEISVSDSRAMLTTPIRDAAYDLPTFLRENGPESLRDASAALVHFAEVLEPVLQEELFIQRFARPREETL